MLIPYCFASPVDLCLELTATERNRYWETKIRNGNKSCLRLEMSYLFAKVMTSFNKQRFTERDGEKERERNDGRILLIRLIDKFTVSLLIVGIRLVNRILAPLAVTLSCRPLFTETLYTIVRL